jgi:soluble lytic murein transglycosylase-like protein
MNLTDQQILTKEKIKKFAELFNIDPSWAAAVSMVESSLGVRQVSPTGCRGAFQMSTVAMKDLLQEMGKYDDDLIDIACGCAFLYLLLKRHKTIREATSKFCDPNDRFFYIDKVLQYMEIFNAE